MTGAEDAFVREHNAATRTATHPINVWRTVTGSSWSLVGHYAELADALCAALDRHEWKAALAKARAAGRALDTDMDNEAEPHPRNPGK